MALPTQIVERLAQLNIRLESVEERFIRGAGPGGQKINKTSSTVWLRHDATGTEVRRQAERSQAANRLKAWTTLCDKLEARAKAISDESIHRREVERRRTRPKTHGQKVRMIETKKRRAKHKVNRARVNAEG